MTTQIEDTWLGPEESRGGFLRRARAILRRNPNNSVSLPYGAVRIVHCSSVPDTYFSIPARLRVRGKTIKGYISSEDGVYYFTPEREN